MFALVLVPAAAGRSLSSLTSHAEIGSRSQYLLGILRMNLDTSSTVTVWKTSKDGVSRFRITGAGELAVGSRTTPNLAVKKRRSPDVAVAGSGYVLTFLQSDLGV